MFALLNLPLGRHILKSPYQISFHARARSAGRIRRGEVGERLEGKGQWPFVRGHPHATSVRSRGYLPSPCLHSCVEIYEALCFCRTPYLHPLRTLYDTPPHAVHPALIAYVPYISRYFKDDAHTHTSRSSISGAAEGRGEWFWLIAILMAFSCTICGNTVQERFRMVSCDRR